MGNKNSEYYYSMFKRSYGYDILNKNYEIIFSFGSDLKNEFENFYTEMKITKIEKIKIFFHQLKDFIRGQMNKFKYYTLPELIKEWK